MRARRVGLSWRSIFVSLWIGTWTVAACGLELPAEEVSWAVPDPVQKVDFAAAVAESRPLFLEEGAVWERSLGFALVGQEEVTIEASLPEEGEFSVVLANPKAQIEIRPMPARGQTQRVLVARTWKFQTMQDFRHKAESAALAALEQQRQQARQEMSGQSVRSLAAYLRKNSKTKRHVNEGDEEQVRTEYEKLRAVDLGADVLRGLLQEMDRRRKAWVTSDTQKGWNKASGFELMSEYERLLTLDLADQYLTDFGLKRETEQNYAGVIALKVDGIETFASGRSLDPQNVTARQMVRATPSGDLRRVREALTVVAKCRFRLPSDPEDPNSQWFHAQQVVCAVHGSKSIRVEGSLDPTRQDQADWWTLIDYDPSRVRLEFPPVAGVTYQVYSGGGRIHRMRIVGTGNGPLPYSFTMHARKTSPEARTITITESPADAGAKFPF
jgi:hypothetical protein